MDGLGAESPEVAKPEGRQTSRLGQLDDRFFGALEKLCDLFGSKYAVHYRNLVNFLVWRLRFESSGLDCRIKCRPVGAPALGSAERFHPLGHIICRTILHHFPVEKWRQRAVPRVVPRGSSSMVCQTALENHRAKRCELRSHRIEPAQRVPQFYQAILDNFIPLCVTHSQHRA